METQFLYGQKRIGKLTPHSLGKLIEWKPTRKAVSCFASVPVTPHSLGKQIEWKLLNIDSSEFEFVSELPTRWGNKLNGNSSIALVNPVLKVRFTSSPHLLGKLIEWKLILPMKSVAIIELPTR
jgi:hypothetical protein